MTSYTAQINCIRRSLHDSLERHRTKLERLTAQLKFADQLCAAYPELAPDWQACILEAGRLAQEQLGASSINVDQAIADAEERLLPIGQAAKQYTLLCVSHAHIDMNWMWSWPETVAVTNDTFETMLTLMGEFPEFIFSQSQASVYELIERYNPAMFEVIRQRIQEGRWEVTASQWVEGDKNMSSGESISRHLLYTRAYMQEKFGLLPKDVQVDFEPDTFGHPATLPTILAQGGVRYYYHCRGSHGPHLYWWLGRDGSRLLTLNDVVWYMCAIEPNIADPLVEFSQATGLKFKTVLYGVGDHGGGPTRRDLRRIAELNAWPIYPNVRCATLHEFFRSAEGQAPGLPEIAGERNRVFTGCYTSQARQKWANRHGENLLYAAEAAATIGAQVAGVPYPQESLEAAWKHLLFDQFHDILPGSGTRDTRHYALGRAQESQAAAGMARNNALRSLAARVDTEALREDFAEDAERAYQDEVESERALGAGVGFASGTGGQSAYSAAQRGDRAFLIFNPLPFERCEVVEAKLWDTSLDEDQLVVTAQGLAPQPIQVLDRGRYWGHEYTTVAFPVQVPGLGYRAVCISDRRAEMGLGREQAGDPWAGMLGSWRQIQPSDYCLENEWLCARLDPASGGLTSLVDKKSGREWVPEGGLSGILQYNVEAHEGMTAWVIGQFLTREDLIEGGHLVQGHRGPYVNSYRWTRAVSHSTLELEITLRQGSPQLEYQLTVDWREMGTDRGPRREGGIPHLRVRFPLALDEPKPRYEIPFGAISRDLHAGEEVPAQRWADVSEADGAGVTLTNSSKYGHSLNGHSLEMTLLRASIDPDPLPDLGEHVIEYALQPHGAGWTIGDAMRSGQVTNAPLSVMSCTFQSGELPTALSFAHVKETNVHLGTLKQGQSGGIVLRLIEVDGLETEAHVKLAPHVVTESTTVRLVDTLERPLDKSTNATMRDGTLLVHVPAHGIVAVQLLPE